ncbi:hypothetical protein [Cytobacillus oceanisediminis]|uniref:Uncharacterized protein n=1 Tax=Cytobacillus oceanisediminis TaxID=665099 RepID=A0A562J2P2_9BACI|nr:hypothetical protein [Cytobacillus oceanisediminis]TWH77094.1 hypothetical protein IQ19_05642 [Cytobacillus oceanisediminis]
MVFNLFKKKSLQLVSPVTNADRTLTLDNGLPVLEENNEWLDYEMIMKRYNKGV